MRALLAEGQVMVVETEDDWFLGTVELVDGTIVVRSGFVGRPVVLPADVIQSIVPAQLHPNAVQAD